MDDPCADLRVLGNPFFRLLNEQQDGKAVLVDLKLQEKGIRDLMGDEF
jgi:hypothetical protein